VAVTLSAINQRQAIAFSVIVCESPDPAPKPAPKPVAKRAAQGVLRTARRPTRTKPLRRLVTQMRAGSWKRCGIRPYREIAEELTNRNIPTPRCGDTWNWVTVMRVMKRLRITGK
jgi:hypothetical protein